MIGLPFPAGETMWFAHLLVFRFMDGFEEFHDYSSGLEFNTDFI